MERYDLVEKAYNELVASGVVHDSTNGEELDGMKGAVTFRAAYYINQVNPNRGLLAKFSGANVKGFKADVIMDKDGTTFDISTDNGRKIIIQNPRGNFEPNLIDLWRQPTAELAGLNEIPPIDIPPTNPPTTVDLTPVLNKIHELEDVIHAQNDMLLVLGGNITDLMNGLNIVFPEYETNKVPIFGVVTLKPKPKQ